MEHRPPVGDQASQLAQEAWQVFGTFAGREATPDAIAHLDALRGKLDQIPSAYALPFGIGAVAGPMVRMISRLRSKRAMSEESRLSRHSAKTGN